MEGLQGNGDKGYLTKLRAYFQEKNIQLTIRVRKNMQPPKLSEEEKYFLYKRGIIESVIDKLKNQRQIDIQGIEVLRTLWSISGQDSLLISSWTKSPKCRSINLNALSKNIVLIQDLAA
ncbi:MAG: transposase [Raineya sp.]|nr:transposase [Raineya sp.]